MEYDFSVGDQVKYNSKTGRYLWLNGYCGTIVGFFNQGTRRCARVEWEDPVYTISENQFKGHDCDGLSKPGFGWHVLLEDLELFVQEDSDFIDAGIEGLDSII